MKEKKCKKHNAKEYSENSTTMIVPRNKIFLETFEDITISTTGLGYAYEIVYCKKCLEEEGEE